MLAIIGTIPDAEFPLTCGEVQLKNEYMLINGRKVPINRGTPALIAAAVHVAETLGLPAPAACLAGDIGLGYGSRKLYEWLTNNLADTEYDTLAFHYLQPDVDWQFKILAAVDKMKKRPHIVADAGFMYAAKMSGMAGEYDLFTPDMGELAFLADEQAPHPFYTRGFILHEDQKAEDLITLAYKHDNGAKHMLIKGATDLVANSDGILHSINNPNSANMEAIGGTGDTVTGTVSVLIDSKMPIDEAAKNAALINRWAGEITEPTPATQILEIAGNLNKACSKVLG